MFCINVATFVLYTIYFFIFILVYTRINNLYLYVIVLYYLMLEQTNLGTNQRDIIFNFHDCGTAKNIY